MLPLTVKYAPKSLSEITGQDLIVTRIKDFIQNFKLKKKKALLLYGPPGAGKTSTAHATAKEYGYEIIEVNASDFRDEKKLNASVGEASKQRSLFFKSKIILVDEVDGLIRKDRGAVPTLVKLIKESAYPIILTANNPWNKKYSKLRTACDLVEFKPLTHQMVLNLLRKVCEKEKIQYEEKALSSLARRSGGDMRGALIDLQLLSTHKAFTMEHLDVLDERRKTQTIFNALLRVFKTTDAFVARTAFNDVEEDLQEIQLWIDENLPKEYTKPIDLYRAYEKISRADIFRRRIMKRQHWRFLAIINVLLSAGIALSKDEKYKTFVKYTPTMRLLKIWRANQKNAKRKAIAEKIGLKTHCSTKVALEKTLPYVKHIFMKNKLASQPLIDYFDFNSEEVLWLSKT